MKQKATESGHRARLRTRFRTNPTTFSEAELLELLLTFAIPRRDVAPLAQQLLDEFGSLDRVFAAQPDVLGAVKGVGEVTVTLLSLVHRLSTEIMSGDHSVNRIDTAQPALFQLLTESREEPEMRTYANDEISNALNLIPKAARFNSLDAYKSYLEETLPYNSVSTRHRRTNYIVNRFFPDETLDTPLAYYASRCSEEELKPALFFHILKVEPLAFKVAEELIWPALPVGFVERETMRDFVLRQLPDIGKSSQKNILRALFNTYQHLGVGEVDDTVLRFRIHTGTLAGFLYILTSQYSEPGIYSLDALEQGPMHRWLLWDRAWLRRQLYNLRDTGIVSKISEIDTVRQFTLAYSRSDALHHYYENVDRDRLVLREKPDGSGV